MVGPCERERDRERARKLPLAFGRQCLPSAVESYDLESYLQASAVVAGLAVGAAAYAGKAAIEIFTRYRSAPRLRQFYKVFHLPDHCLVLCTGKLWFCVQSLLADYVSKFSYFLKLCLA